MALSGALMPGPLLTYTVARTVQTERRGFLIGPLVVAGHAALELLLVVALVIGVTQFLRIPVVIKSIGVLGGLLLGYMGIGLVGEAVRHAKAEARPQEPARASLAVRMNPILAGTLLSLSNPYWWVWWVTVGSATLLRFGVSLSAWQGFVAFFLGHEAGDLGWYFVVSSVTHMGRSVITGRVYAAVLAVCGAAIVGFGLYLGISPFVTAL